MAKDHEAFSLSLLLRSDRISQEKRQTRRRPNFVEIQAGKEAESFGKSAHCARIAALGRARFPIVTSHGPRTKTWFQPPFPVIETLVI
jgi:hypothetical protein